MAAGVTEHLWEIEDIVALLDNRRARSTRTLGVYIVTV